MSRVTRDAGVMLMELTRALEKTGLTIVRDGGRTVERGAAFPLDLAKVLAHRGEVHAPELVSLDAPTVHQDEAVEHVVHHLMLAAMFFEGTPDDRGRQINEEIQRMVSGKRLDEHVGNAASTFVEVLDSYYEGLKEADDDGE